MKNKNLGKKIFLRRFSFSLLMPFAILFAIGYLFKDSGQLENLDYEWSMPVENTMDTIANRYQLDGKQRGVHLFGRRGLSDAQISELLKNNIEWITFVPFAWQRDYNSDMVGRSSSDYTYLSRRDSSFIQMITKVQDKGFHVMIKPHIWMRHASSGKWRADISHADQASWQSWSESYKRMILHYAGISEQLNVKMFCIGTELHQVVNDHPGFWRELIKEVRGCFSGKITYAANWNDEVEDVSFWGELDYIGIQAYYPLTRKPDPEVGELLKGWKRHLNQIERLHQKYNKPILFTEIGYKSTPDAAIEPWQWVTEASDPTTEVSFPTQANCYEAFFRTFWNKEWFAGVHIWEWQPGRDPKGKWSITNFTPQQKPAEDIMAKWYGVLSSEF